MTPSHWVQELRLRTVDLEAFSEHLSCLRKKGTSDGVWTDDQARQEVLLYGKALSVPARLPDACFLPVYEEVARGAMPAAAREVVASLQRHDPYGRIPAWMLYSGSTTQAEVKAYLWLWVCYTLADHLVDGELGSEVVPASLWSQREMWRCLETVPSEAREYFAEHLTVFENVLGDSDPFAPWQRSGPVAALIAVAGWEANSPEETCRQVLPVLTARQLLDDLHDWREDLERGVQTLPVHLHGTGAPDAKRYWSEVVPQVCEQIELACAAMSPFFAYEAAQYRDAVWRTRTTYQLAQLLQASPAA